MGFHGSIVDPSLFILQSSYTLYILVYVDGMIVTGSDQAVVTDSLCRLSREFTIHDLGELNYFLGIRVL